MKFPFLIATLAFALSLSPTLQAVAPAATLENFLHVDTATAERLLGAERVKKLQATIDDFNAVLIGRPPIHAKVARDLPLPADGGTTFYRGDGYKLTIIKSLFSFGDPQKSAIHGYMYGPVIEFDSALGTGNTSNINHVSFYPAETLNKLIGTPQ
jgi:hypothetical protein